MKKTTMKNENAIDTINNVEKIKNETAVSVEKQENPRHLIAKTTNTWMKKSKRVMQDIFIKIEASNLDKQAKNNVYEKVLQCINEFENKLTGILNETTIISQFASLSPEQKEMLKKML